MVDWHYSKPPHFWEIKLYQSSKPSLLFTPSKSDWKRCTAGQMRHAWCLMLGSLSYSGSEWTGELPLTYSSQALMEKQCLHDLWVLVSTDLSFCEQIDKAVGSATRMAGLVLRTFRRRSRDRMITLLRSLVQLDYCSQLWSHRDQTNINKIEAVQRQFLSHLPARLIGRSFHCWGLTPKNGSVRGIRSAFSGS